jgi:hypothetical protein
MSSPLFMVKNHRLIMALPDLLSIFDFDFKKGVTVPPFAWSHHA